ncbi:MAG: Ig-like domain-containing protein [Sulfurovaceae bacterium]
MSQNVAVIVKDGQNVVSNNVVMEGSGAAGKPLIIKAGSKQSIELKDLATHVAPDQVRVTKDGKNLKIKLGKKASVQDDAADIIIEEYFDNDASLIGVAENGQYYNFIPQGANYASYYSLGGEVIGEETATDWMPLVLGLLGAGALAALASGGGGSKPVDNMAPESLTIIVTDDVNPDTGVIVSTDITTLKAAASSTAYPVTDDNTPTISGVTEAGATVTIKDGAATLTTVTADANGNYTFTPTTPLSEGTHSITVTATDAAGNPITETTGYFTIDTTPPKSISMTVADDVAPITGEIANNGVTDDTTPTISGKTEAGATVTIADGTTVLGTVTADGNGHYEFTPGTPLSEGAHSVSATATDAAGNTITSATTNFTVDTTAPTATADIIAITTDTGAVDFITSDTTLVIIGTNTALGSDEKVQISLDGGKTWLDAAQNDATHWSYDNRANAMTSGEHTLQSRVIDAAGNADSVSTQTITIDTAAPTNLSVNLYDDAAPITGPITAGSITNDTTPVISGITEAGASVTAKDDAGNTLGTATADSNGNYTITPTTSLSEGQHYISVTAADAAGNPFTVSSGVFTVDTTAPTAPILDPTDGSIVVGTAEPGSTITITDGNGDPIGTTTANQNGNFSYTPDTLISDGTVINATATDAAGNESQPGTTTVDAEITDAPIVYDDIAPIVGQVLSGDTTNDDKPTFSGLAGSVPAGVTVTIYDNGAQIGTTTSNPDGSWSFTPIAPFADGSDHSITYTKNGSTANHSPAVNFTVDTAAPTITMALTDDVAPVTGDITNGSTTNDTKPTISGVTEAGATVTVKDGTTVLGTVVADSSGNYSFTPIAPLNEGAHSVNATATDASGNTVTSTTTNFTVDSIAPTIEMTITDDVGAAQGLITNGAIIDDTKPTISGKTEANATVTIKDGTTVLGTVTADANGDYTFTPDEPLSMDQHTITATATDAAGNTTTSVPTTFTIAPPEVIDLGDDGQLINPVFVDGNYYYYWDRDKDGEGIVNGNPDQDDWFTHDELDAVFMYDVNGAKRPDNLTDTNDTYRYAELEGYQVALPTYGGDKLNDHPQLPTNIDNDPEGEINPTYDDLVAIWDAFEGHPDLANGITSENGTPPEWANGIYWSATPYETTQHYAMDLTNGTGGTNGETNQSWTAVQVIF